MVSDSTLQKEAIDDFSSILGAKAGVMSKFRGEIPKLLILEIGL